MSSGSRVVSAFIYLLYFVARVLLFPLLVLYFLYRSYRDRRYFRTRRERLGRVSGNYKRTAPGSIWLHAVSVGEVLTAVRLIKELRAANPAIPLYLSTTTLAGRALAQEKVAESVNGIFYAPIDYVFAVRRVLRAIRPAVVVILETEIWPSLYREVKRAQCELLIVNGRISDRALPRYRAFRPAFRAALEWPDAIFTQAETDRERYIDIGAPAARVKVGGNLKYDAVAPGAPPQPVVDLIARSSPDQVWIAASTMPGVDASDPDENDLVLGVFEQLSSKYPRLLLILAPRKPERFGAVAETLRARGLNYTRRSRLDQTLQLPGVLLLDTIGELASVFPLGDVVFMGGTLARRGGHNILEPAFAGRTIVIGPHMENFAAIAAQFRSAGAVVEIASLAELTTAIDALLMDAQRRSKFGRLAAALANRDRGVTARIVSEILTAQDRAIPAWNLYGFGHSLLRPLASLWKWGSTLKRSEVDSKALSTPVISVGGIAMGGSGKTPFVLMLAEHFHKLGLQPGILTRGYGRRSIAKMILVDAGSTAKPSVTGDEAQIFVRSGVAHVGICSDRWPAGRALEEKNVGVFLLDDGFQHRRLKRDLDIVLIDALNPFAGGAVFPRGRLREPLDALARADAFVLTRTQPGRMYQGIRDRLSRINPKARVFLATVALKRWVRARTQQTASPPSGPVAAICGLGNPDTFWQTLRNAGLDPVYTWTFRDHHVYKAAELRRVAAQARARGAEAIVTTEKDAMNLPPDFDALIAPLELYWLEIETTIQDEAGLFALIDQVLPSSLPRSRISRQQA